MGKRVIIVFLVSIVCAALLFSSANAADFKVAVNETERNVCAGSSYTDAVNVTNNDAVARGYRIGLSGTASQWTAIAAETLILEPGETKSIDKRISTPLGTKGSFELLITVFDNEQATKRVLQRFSIGRCSNLRIDFEQQGYSACECSPVYYRFKISNRANYEESYLFSAEPFSEYVRFSHSKASLPAGKSAFVDVLVELPCNLTGKHELGLLTRAEHGKLIARTPFFLDVRECYGFNISQKLDEVALCEFRADGFSFNIGNTGITGNNFSISIDGPEWVELAEQEDNATTIDHGMNMDVGLVASPAELSNGTHALTVTVSSEKGRHQKALNYSLVVDQCYGIGIEPKKEQRPFCCIPEQALLTVSNKGIFAENVALSASADLGARFDQSMLRPESGQEKDVALYIEPGCEKTGQQAVTLQAVILKEDVAYSAEKELVFDIVSLEECYQPNVINNNFFYGKSLVMFKPESALQLRIANRGVRNTSYSLLLEGPAWLSLAEQQVTLGAGESKVLQLTASAPADLAFGTYDAVISAVPDAGDKAFTATLQLTYRQKNTLDEVRIWAHSTYTLLFVDYWILTLIGFILLLLLIYYVVRAIRWLRRKLRVIKEKRRVRREKAEARRKILEERRRRHEEARKSREAELERKRKEREAEARKRKQEEIARQKAAARALKPKKIGKKPSARNVLIGILLVLLLALVIDMIYIFSPLSPRQRINETTILAPTTTVLPEDFPLQENKTVIIWDKNTQKKVVLDEYVYDPDFDVLEYDFEVPDERQYVDVSIRDGVATLTPKRNWHGEQRIVFSVSDGKGARAYLPEMTFIVRDAEQDSVSSYIRVLTAFIVIIVLTIILSSLARKPRRRRGSKQ